MNNVPFESSNGQIARDLPPGFRNPTYTFQSPNQVFNVNLDCNTYCVDAVPTGATITLLTNQGVSNPTPGRAYKTDGAIKILTISSSVAGTVTLTAGFGLLTMTEAVVTASLDAIDVASGLEAPLGAVNLGFAYGEALATVPYAQNQGVLETITPGTGFGVAYSFKPGNAAAGLVMVEFNLSALFTVGNIAGTNAAFIFLAQGFGTEAPVSVYDANGFLLSREGRINAAALTPGTAQILRVYVDVTGFSTLYLETGVVTGTGFVSFNVSPLPSSFLKQIPQILYQIGNGSLGPGAAQSLVAGTVGLELWLLGYSFSWTTAANGGITTASGGALMVSGQGIVGGSEAQEFQPLVVSSGSGGGFGIVSSLAQTAYSVQLRYGVVYV